MGPWRHNQGCKKPIFFILPNPPVFFLEMAKMGFLNLAFSNFSLITKYKISYLPYFKFIIKD